MKKLALLLLVAACLGAGGVQADAPPTKPLLKADRCPPAPGSRLSRAPDAEGRCNPPQAFSRSYSQEEIERTGQIDLDRALMQLDPALTLGRSRP
ncbi:MAG: hypothetical protein V4650_16320 [Pseudomonadota bacterium]